MRGLIITRGMSFRDGTRGTRIYGTDYSIENQKEATLSHSKLFHNIRPFIMCQFRMNYHNIITLFVHSFP